VKAFLRRLWFIIPKAFRKPLVFVVGLLLILVSPVVGSIPGPGGIIVFLAGIGILATEFDWAENLKVALTKTVPAELKKRWQPTPRWELVFDATTVALLAGAIVFYVNGFRVPVVSFTATAVAIAVFNRNRLDRLKARLKRKR
jgi:hypothetical protein